MNIDPTDPQSLGPLERLGQRPNAGAANRAERPGAPESQSGERFQPSEEALRQRDLVKALMAETEVRPEVVAQGKALAADPDFPSDADIDRLARALLSTLEEEA
jgi:hypothetical protein